MEGNRPVWYVLVNVMGDPFTSANKVKISSRCTVAEFKNKMKTENPRKLPSFSVSNILVYANKAAFDRKDEPLGVGETFEDHGKLVTDPLLVFVPSHYLGSVHDGPNAEFSPVKKQRINDLTDKFKAFKDAKLVSNCIISGDGMMLPFPSENLKTIFVRKSYEDIFALLVEKIENGIKSFGISGTSGIGKSLFFVYILYRLVHYPSPLSTFKPKRILYQVNQDFIMFDLEEYYVGGIKEIDTMNLVLDPGTFYIIDGDYSVPVLSRCVSLFIGLPRSEQYKEFVKQKKALEWFLPVWTLNELYDCHRNCFPHVDVETLDDRYRIFGGVARLAFHPDGDKMFREMNAALKEVDTVQSVCNVGGPTLILPTAYLLFHIIVSDDGNYIFAYVDIASKYVGEQLWQKHSARMVLNLQEMFGFGWCLNEISRHLFEIYGHLVFSQGGKTLKCRNLDDGSLSSFLLDGFNGKRESFTRNSIPTKPIEHYYEPTDDDTFPAIDSLSPQGMFQFTVGTEHPIRGVQILKDVCKAAFDKPYKLYFVVPPNRFAQFEKQPYKATMGNDPVNSIEDLEQYVLELELN